MKYLVIGPGAMGFFMFMGVISKLNIESLEEISGSSAGGLLGFLFLAAKGEVSKVLDYSLNAPVKQVTKPNIRTLLGSMGLVARSKVRKTLCHACRHFTGRDDMTFAEFYAFHPVKLHLSAYCLDLCKTVYFSVESTPTMSVVDALCATIAIPFLFEPTKLGDGWSYIDGGWAEATPCAPFLGQDSKNVLVIATGRSNHTIPIKDLKSYAMNIVKSTMTMRLTYEFPTIAVDAQDFNFLDFGMTNDTKLKMFLSGHSQVFSNSKVK